MNNIGDFINASELASLAGVKNARGIQCGILVNDEDSHTILIPKLPDEITIQNYPNQWDQDIVGLLHFCGTNKGQTKKQFAQNLESKLNKYVNESIYPIHVYTRHSRDSYMYMGEFVRVPKYDKWIELDGKKVIVFGLISKEIKNVEPLISMVKYAKQ